jgi:cytidine deaminase
MDDRNLVAVAEQAAATARTLRGPLEGATVKGDDGRVFLGCRMEYQDPSLDQDAIANGIAAGRAQGMRKVARVGLYSPVESGLPPISPGTLQRLQELAAPGLAVIFSSGSGDRVERTLKELLAEAGLPA